MVQTLRILAFLEYTDSTNDSIRTSDRPAYSMIHNMANGRPYATAVLVDALTF